MSNEALTACVIVAAIIILGAYDVWVLRRQPDGKATISWVLRVAAARWPIVAFAFGVLVGHLFWFNCP